MTLQADARLVACIVETSRYPLTSEGSAAWDRVVSRVRRDLRDFGCSVLPQFVRAGLLEDLRVECKGLEGRAYYSEETVNVYNTDVNPTWPPEHPGRWVMRRGNAFVARDQIPAEFIVHRLYTSRLFQNFLASCLGLPQVHPLADPLAGLCLNIVLPGREHPWHFDTNEFAVSMLTHAPEGGGYFDYCPNIRSDGAENFGDVRAVRTGGDAHLARRLQLRPGGLQLFRGRYSLHRVSTVEGSTARHSAIFAYSQRSGVAGTAVRSRQLFGRVAPRHDEGNAVQIDELLD